MKQLNLLSSAGKQGKIVTQIIHFVGGDKKTIEGVMTDTIRQGQFTQFQTKDGRLIFINDRNVNMFEVIKENGENRTTNEIPSELV